MQIDLWILIVGGLAVLFFGYFFGLFEGRDQGYKKGRLESGEPDPPAQSQETPTQPADRKVMPGLLRLTEEAGRLRLEMDGAELNAASLPAEQRKRLIETVTRLRPWIEAPVQTEEAPAADPAPAAAAAFAVRTPSLVRPAAPEKEPPAAVSSMVGQIDEILQQNIAGTHLADRGLRLIEEPGGGVTVRIDSLRFASIGEVTEPEVQAALRRAISLWEQKYTPGA